MNRCKDCGTIIENNSIRCPNCQEIRQAETFKTIAVVATIIFIIGFALLYQVSLGLSDMSSTWAQEENDARTFGGAIKNACFCLIVNIVPYIVSLICAKKAKLNKLYISELVILAIVLILIFIVHI